MKLSAIAIDSVPSTASGPASAVAAAAGAASRLGADAPAVLPRRPPPSTSSASVAPQNVSLARTRPNPPDIAWEVCTDYGD